MPLTKQVVHRWRATCRLTRAKGVTLGGLTKELSLAHPDERLGQLPIVKT